MLIMCSHGVVVARSSGLTKSEQTNQNDISHCYSQTSSNFSLPFSFLPIMSASEAQIKSEIARLTGTLCDSFKASDSQHHNYYSASINEHKLGKPSTAPGLARRNNS